MSTAIRKYTKLNNGVDMPVIGFGVFLINPGKETQRAVELALETGYRSIDTATFYENEEDVGTAVARSAIPREEIFITTKVWPTDQGYERTLRAFEKSLAKLNTDYVDLYLIHWPEPGKSIDTWKALETIYANKQARAIGLSNYTIDHLEKLKRHWEVQPVINQIEYHPYMQQPKLVTYCEENNIRIEAWSPLMRGNVLRDETIKTLAVKYQRSPAQITLRWELQKGIVIIPKSVHKDRIIENSALFDFSITSNDMKRIDALDKNRRIGPDPHTIRF